MVVTPLGWSFAEQFYSRTITTTMMMTSLLARSSGLVARKTAIATTGIRTLAVTPRSAKTPDDPDALKDNILPVGSLYSTRAVRVVLFYCQSILTVAFRV
jgi:hypothetical protein